MYDISRDNTSFPIKIASILVFITILDVLLVSYLILLSPVSVANSAIVLWHIAICIFYIKTTLYAYKNRESFTRNKINFLLYVGFLLYFFFSYVGCVAIGSMQ